MRLTSVFGLRKTVCPPTSILGALVRLCMVSTASRSLLVDQRRTRIISVDASVNVIPRASAEWVMSSEAALFSKNLLATFSGIR